MIVKTNTILSEKTIIEIREDIKAQIKDGGIVVLDGLYESEVVEFDTLKCEGEFIHYDDGK